MEIEHNIQKEIILKLIHNPHLSFTELWDKKEDSNKFSYHLSTLESKGIILKEDGKYSLSEEGKKLSAFIEGDTGSKAIMPTFAHALIIKDGSNILVQKRLKEPFYGYWSLISGKINFGFNIEECAKKDLQEETGLTAKNSRITGINQIKTFENNKLIFHHIIFLVELTNLSGNLNPETHKGKNEWMTINKFKKEKRLPDTWLDDILDTKNFTLIESERIMKNGEFIDCKLKNMTKLKP